MTRKHFTEIASTLAAVRADLRTCEEMGYTLSKFNQAFDFGKFMDACGHGGS